MVAFSLPSFLAFTIGVLLFNGQVSQQFTIGDGSPMSDQHVSSVEKVAGTSSNCVGSLGSYTCVASKGSCYCFVNKQLSWIKAYEYCKNNRKNLLSVKNVKEQIDIATNVLPLILSDPIASLIGVWTSGALVPALNTFYWTSTLEYFAFANWFSGEPNSSPTAQCVRIVPTPQGNWASLSCNQWLPFVCEE